MLGVGRTVGCALQITHISVEKTFSLFELLTSDVKRVLPNHSFVVRCDEVLKCFVARSLATLQNLVLSR